MKKEILFSFGLSSAIYALALFAHVQDTEFYDYTHDYQHAKQEYDSRPHTEADQFPDFATWAAEQFDKEEKAKGLIDKAIGYVGRYADPLTGGLDASNHICNSSAPDDHDRPSAEHESERH